MQFRLWYLIATLAMFAGVISIAMSPSYEKSLEAKYFYYVGDYTKAKKVATEAFQLDKYNRMASTIMTQSQVALKFTKYIHDAEKYMKIINKISTQESISKADKARVKLICEIMIDSYVKIPSTIVIDSSLMDEAKHYHTTFEKLYEEITPKI